MTPYKQTTVATNVKIVTNQPMNEITAERAKTNRASEAHKSGR
jgi:hypothetical protein